MTFIPWNSQPINKWAQKYAQGKFIDLDGKSTHYIEKGQGDPLILIHGFFYDTFTWNNNIDFFSKHFKVYALDLWGFGYSTREPLEYGYPLYSKQLKLFMDALHIEKANLMGHSMGGGTLIYFSVNNPDRVDKIVLVDPAAMPNPLPFLGKLTNLPWIGEFMFNNNSNFSRRLALRTNWIKDPNFITDKYYLNAMRFHKIQGSSEVLLKILRKQFFDTIPDKVHDLGKLDKNILVVWGKHDAAISIDRADEIQKLIPHAILEVLEDAGHCPHDETADIFNELAIRFLLPN